MQTSSEKNILQRTLRVAAAAAAVGACLGALTMYAPRPVQAQDQGGSASTKKVSLNLVNQPVQTALRLLFTSVGFNNSIDQDVQGYVTINLNDVSFETALRSLLNAANPPLTYDNKDGVYHISVKRDTFIPQTPVATQPTTPVAEGVHLYRIPLDHTDPVTMATILQKVGQRGTILVPVSGSGNGNGNGTGGGNNGFGGGGIGGGNNGFGGAGIGGGGIGSGGIGGFGGGMSTGGFGGGGGRMGGF